MLGIGVLFTVLALFTWNTDIIGFFKWILLIFYWAVGGIGLLGALGILAVGLKLRFSSSSKETVA